jgi:mono/diheme cytochrome c family protein
MRTLARWLRRLALVAAALSGAAALTLVLAFPRAEPPRPGSIEPTAARVERGRYLVHHVASCLDCHSERDWARYAAPVVAGTEGQGARLDWLRSSMVSANITPTALLDWSDGEIARAIASGVRRDGEPLHPMMPFDTYARMTQEDLFSVVVYVRTLAPRPARLERTRGTLAERLIARVLAAPYRPPPDIDGSDTVARGRYLAGLADCGFCHRADHSGGARFPLPDGGSAISADIRPLPGTRLEGKGRDNFIGLFKAFADPASAPPTSPGGNNTVMPWHRYAGMDEADLGAIYDYLLTVGPSRE